MSSDFQHLLSDLKNIDSDDAYEASDALAKLGTEDVLKELVTLLKDDEHDVRFLAARTLGLINDNGAALEPMLDAIKDPSNSVQAGSLLSHLEGFDLSQHYVELFKLYLNGSFKVVHVAEDLLDHKEFNITGRVLKKATKHWNHYVNNVKHDEVFQLKKNEVEERLQELQVFIEKQPD